MTDTQNTHTDFTELIKEVMRAQIAEDTFSLSSAKKFIESLVLELARDYGIADDRHEIKFHSKWTSHAGANYNGAWNMAFGAESIEYFFTNGPLEYKTIQNILDTRGLDNVRGYAGLRILVLHEFAHVIQYHNYKCTFTYTESYDEYSGYKTRATKSVKPHGAEFKHEYATLLDTYAKESR